MTGGTSHLHRLLSHRPWGRLVLVVGALLLVAGPLIPIGGLISGLAGSITVAVALATCLLSSLLSILLGHKFRDPSHVLHQLLIGIMLRMGIPLFACMLAYLRVGMLAESGFVYYIMIFYFVALTVETVLLASGIRN